MSLKFPEPPGPGERRSLSRRRTSWSPWGLGVRGAWGASGVKAAPVLGVQGWGRALALGAPGANYMERKPLAWAGEGVVRVMSPTWPSPGPQATCPQTPPGPFQEPLCDLSQASPLGQWLPAGVGVAGSKGPSPTGHRPPERGAGTRQGGAAGWELSPCKMLEAGSSGGVLGG